MTLEPQVCYRRLIKKPTGKDIDKPEIDELAACVKNGAKAFLKEEYRGRAVED